MKFENTEAFGFECAMRGMRNPLESWNKSDSGYGCNGKTCEKCKHSDNGVKPYCFGNGREYIIGENDLKLAQKLILAGSEHRKFMRQIFISVYITAPLYWWKEEETYKIGTTSNPTSTMHKLSTTTITLDCFEMDDYNEVRIKNDEPISDCAFHNHICNTIQFLETLRLKYLETKDIKYWKELIRWLPSSWLQTRTVTMSYENVMNMYNQRVKHPHKLTEWRVSFGNWVEQLPYSKELIMIDKLPIDTTN